MSPCLHVLLTQNSPDLLLHKSHKSLRIQCADSVSEKFDVCSSDGLIGLEIESTWHIHMSIVERDKA